MVIHLIMALMKLVFPFSAKFLTKNSIPCHFEISYLVFLKLCFLPFYSEVNIRSIFFKKKITRKNFIRKNCFASAKCLVIVIILYFSFFSTANLDRLAKVVSAFSSIVALGVCVTIIELINMA